MTQGIYVDTLRGFDSTGIVAVNTNTLDRCTHYKRALPGYDFIETRRYRKILDGASSLACAIGHNRAATRGSITDESAHPYRHGDINLAHNGTLEFNTGMRGKFETDSEEIAHTMSEDGAKDTLPRIRGAFALVWYDTKKQTLNFARNEEREFHYAIGDDNKSIYWASEAMMLELLLHRAGIKHRGACALPVGVWHEFEMKDTLDTCFKNKFNAWVPLQGNWGGYYSNNKAASNANKNNGSNKKALKNTADRASKIAASVHLTCGAQIGYEVTAIEAYTDTKNKNRKHPIGLMRGEWVQKVTEHGRNIDTIITEWAVDVDTANKEFDGDMSYAVGTVKDYYLGWVGSREVLQITVERSWAVGTIAQYSAGELDWCMPILDTDSDASKKKASDDMNFYQGPNDIMIPKVDMEDLLKDGCSCCGEAMGIKDALNCEWSEPQGSHPAAPICLSCVLDVPGGNVAPINKGVK